MRVYVLVMFIISTFPLCAQEKEYPQDFGLPLEIPVELSATFGELRGNHFHAGLDFKTQQRTGLKVLTVGDGYVSRIKISRYGYGKALYVTHPNGYTTVYGHLKNFSPKIEAYVKKQQYIQKNFEIQLFPKASELSVGKGEMIAYSGNTGGSGAPHLHFEYRDTKTEKIINPLYFGIDQQVKDAKAPIVLKLIAYPIGVGAVVNQSQEPIEIQLKEKGDGNYIAQPVKASGLIGFGLQSYDLSNKNWNRKGLFHVQTVLNGDPLYEYKYDSFSFFETRYINAFIDYEYYINNSNRVQKLFRAEGNKLSTIKKEKNKGLVEVLPNLNFLYYVTAKDFHGNTTTVTIPVLYSDDEILIKNGIKSESSYPINVKIDNSLVDDGVEVFMPANSFYKDFNFELSINEGIASIHNNTVPVHKKITISFDISKLNDSERKGLYIASKESGEWQYNTSKIKGSTISVRVKLLGDYKLDYDRIAPVISNVSFQKKEVLSKNARIKLKIKDQKSGIKGYKATVDGKWFLMEYERKLDRLTGDLSDLTLEKGKHELKVVVTDKLENQSEIITFFVTK